MIWAWLCRFNSPFTNFEFMRNYLPLPISHLLINICTCINCDGDISLHAWFKIANQNGHWHGHNVLLHFAFVRMRIAITCIVPRGYLMGPP